MGWKTVGWLLIAFGAGWMLDALGLWDFDAGTWWPLALIVPGVVRVLEGGRRRSGWTLILLGLLLLVGELGGIPPAVGRLVWPALLVAAGLYLVLRRGTLRREADVVSGKVDAFAAFSTHRAAVREPFRGGTAASLFGEVVLDLRHADGIAPGATLDALTLFGGVTVLVPPGWRVTTSGMPIFGSVEDRRPTGTGAEPAPTLSVRGIAVFGEIVVRD